jgi:hypothetical protein
LEKFVHELNALWKLSGSSMGALRELVAVAGMMLKSGENTMIQGLNTNIDISLPMIRSYLFFFF